MKGPPLGKGFGQQRLGQRSPKLPGKPGRQTNPAKPQTELTHTHTPLLIQNHVHSTMNSIVSMGIVSITNPGSPAGQLAHFLPNWEKISKDRWVLDTVRGYFIEFHSLPQQSQKPCSPTFNQSQQQLIEQEVEQLLLKEVVRELPSLPVGGFYSTLFLVPKKDGGQRPVINLKCLNAFIEAPHFKMEGIHTLKIS